MSLINVKNFVAPLTNKVHLVTLLFVVILFVVYRLSGGAVQIGETRTGRIDRKQSASEQKAPGRGRVDIDKILGQNPDFDASPKSIVRELMPNSKASTTTMPDSQQIEVSEEEMSAILAAQKARREEQARKNNDTSKQPPKRGAFDDIEKSLGLK